jgi:hypothetical protein
MIDKLTRGNMTFARDIDKRYEILAQQLPPNDFKYIRQYQKEETKTPSINMMKVKMLQVQSENNKQFLLDYTRLIR